MSRQLNLSSQIVVSKSLILTQDKYGAPDSNFCLGLPDWCPCCIEKSKMESRCSKSMTLKRRKNNEELTIQSTEKKAKESIDRFSFDTTMEDLQLFKEGHCPSNTVKNNEWALRTFESWRVARNAKYTSDQCPSNMFVTGSHKELCEWLCKFITEARKADGMEYTPRSLYLLLCALQRHIRDIRSNEDTNLFQQPVFHPLKNVCDAVFKRLHNKGIGTDTKVTAVLSEDEENTLWKKGSISLDNPTGLLNAVFFYNGKNFCLRGGAEHRNLKISQLRRETTIVDDKEISCYVYTEFGSKNNQGGFASLNRKNKVVRQYECDLERCHVKILDKYLQALPPEAIKNDIFYLQPLAQVPANPSAPWFKTTPVGKNTLGTMIKRMCSNAGISERFTNHSLRAYGATTLFQAEVPEKLIQQRTGHRSVEGVRRYERTSESQLLDISNIMSCGSKVPSNSALSATKKQMPVATRKLPYDCQPRMAMPSAKKSDNVTFVLNNCNFSGCSVTLSGQGTSGSTQESIEEEQICSETLMDINVDDIFDNKEL